MSTQPARRRLGSWWQRHSMTAQTASQERPYRLRRSMMAAGPDGAADGTGPGDTIVARNLQPTTSGSIDRIRVFRLIRTELDLRGYKLTVEPESAQPTLAAQLAN